MASYEVNFTINVEGTDESVKSICEAINNYKPEQSYCTPEASQNTIELFGCYPITNEDDACEFAQIIARASKGANFKAIGDTECSVGGDIMKFEIELKDGNLTLRHSTWVYYWGNYDIEGCETYEEYLEELDSGLSEENFNFLLENEYGYDDNGKLVLEPSFIDEFQLEY